jgi:hypothetical protein
MNLSPLGTCPITGENPPYLFPPPLVGEGVEDPCSNLQKEKEKGAVKQAHQLL